MGRWMFSRRISHAAPASPVFCVWPRSARPTTPTFQRIVHRRRICTRPARCPGCAIWSGSTITSALSTCCSTAHRCRAAARFGRTCPGRAWGLSSRGLPSAIATTIGGGGGAGRRATGAGGGGGAAGHGRGGVRAVPGAGRIPRPYPAWPGRHGRRMAAPRAYGTEWYFCRWRPIGARPVQPGLIDGPVRRRGNST